MKASVWSSGNSGVGEIDTEMGVCEREESYGMIEQEQFEIDLFWYQQGGNNRN